MPQVFLSYASDDNAKPDEDSEGWVSYFDKCLKIELKRLDDVTLWRDLRNFTEMGPVVDLLKTQVKASQILLVVLSSHYRRNEYTRLELTQFWDAKVALGDKPGEFILPVLDRPLAADQYPPPLRGLKYIPFFEIDRETSAPLPFYQGYGRVISDKYWKAIAEVAKFIEGKLLDLQQRTAAPPKATVFLAEPGADQANNHWTIFNELESQNCRILPGEPWPVNTDDARTHLKAALKDARFSVHLLGAHAAGAGRSGLPELAALQLGLAAERQDADQDFRRLIWIPPDQASDDPKQTLVRELESGKGLRATDELVRAGIEVFKEVVRDELAA